MKNPFILDKDGTSAVEWIKFLTERILSLEEELEDSKKEANKLKSKLKDLKAKLK